MGRHSKYWPEFRGEAVELVIETSRPIVGGVGAIGMNPGTLETLLDERGGHFASRYRRLGEEQAKRRRRL